MVHLDSDDVNYYYNAHNHGKGVQCMGREEPLKIRFIDATRFQMKNVLLNMLTIYAIRFMYMYKEEIVRKLEYVEGAP